MSHSEALCRKNLETGSSLYKFLLRAPVHVKGTNRNPNIATSIWEKIVQLLKWKQKKSSLEKRQEKLFPCCMLDALSSHLWKINFEFKVDSLTFFLLFKTPHFFLMTKQAFFSAHLSVKLKTCCYVTGDNVFLIYFHWFNWFKGSVPFIYLFDSRDQILRKAEDSLRFL